MNREELLGMKKYLEVLQDMKADLKSQQQKLKPKKIVRDGTEMKSLKEIRDWFDDGYVSESRYERAVEKFEENNKDYFDKLAGIKYALILIQRQINDCESWLYDEKG